MTIAIVNQIIAILIMGIASIEQNVSLAIFGAAVLLFYKER